MQTSFLFVRPIAHPEPLTTGLESRRSVRPFLHWPLTLAATLAAGILLGATLFGHSSGRDDVAKNLLRIQEVLSYIRHDYVDSVNTDALGQHAIEGMLERLDPHSSYVPAEDLKMANAQLEEDFDGIGVEFVLMHDTIQVVAPIAGGPSEKAGVHAGDRIVKVNGEQVAGVHISNTNVFNKLRGPRGSSVDLVLARPGSVGLVSVSLKRDRIPTRSVEVALMTDARTGYIRISRFSGGTDREFRDALRGLKKQNMERLVLDLRDNPGGYLDKAIKVADEFLENGRTITYTEGKATRYNNRYKATKNGMFESGGLTVLIDEGSASAAEILAGALQDNDRAVIVGRRSFGKGLVQMPISLTDGSELRLTISRYHTPSGRCIQKAYDSKDLARYDEDLDERYSHGELFYEDSIRNADTVQYRTVAGRVVYGGGGIKPDVFVPIDTSLNNATLVQMENAYILTTLGRAYAAQHSKALRGQGLSGFKRSFSLTPDMESNILAAARREGIKVSDAKWAQIRPLVAERVKASVARAAFDEKGFYSVLLDHDPEFAKAVQAFPTRLAAK